MESRRTGLIRGLWNRFRDADVQINSAAVAYNAFLGLVPLTFGLIAVAAFIGQDQEALARVEETLAVIAPQSVVDFISDLLIEADRQVGGSQGWLIAVSVLAALFFGSRAVAALQKALGHVENRTETRTGLRLRLVAVALTIAGGLAMIVTSFLLVAGSELIRFLEELWGFEALETIWAWLRVPVSAAGLFAFLLAFYHWGPPEPLPKSWLAALVATTGVVSTSLLFGLYLSLTPSLGATLGTLGAVGISLIWLYLGAFAILAGAVVVAFTLRWRLAEDGADRPAPGAVHAAIGSATE